MTDGLSIAYGKYTALRDVSLPIPRGKYTVAAESAGNLAPGLAVLGEGA